MQVTLRMITPFFHLVLKSFAVVLDVIKRFFIQVSKNISNLAPFMEKFTSCQLHFSQFYISDILITVYCITMAHLFME